MVTFVKRCVQALWHLTIYGLSYVARDLRSLPLLRLPSFFLPQLLSNNVSVEVFPVGILYVIQVFGHFFNEHCLLGLTLHLPSQHLADCLGLLLREFLLRYPLGESFLKFVAQFRDPQHRANFLQILKIGIVRFSQPPIDHLFHFALECQWLDQLVLLSFNGCFRLGQLAG